MKFVVKVLFCALAVLVLAAGALAQGKAGLWDGNQWTKMSYDAKVGYVAGAGNLADFDASASRGKYGVITRAFSSELKAKTVGQIVGDVDKYYQENPNKLGHLGSRSDPDAVHHGVPAGDGGRNKMNKMLILVMVVAVSVGACSGMSYTEQRTLSGGAIGAGSGALIGWAAGNPTAGAAIGAGAGALGGFLYDQYEKSQGRP